MVKDCDNSFKLNIENSTNNFVSYCKLDKLKVSDISSKSYLHLDKLGIITNIVEKKIISNMFCCGGYYFNNSDEFLKYSNTNLKSAFVSDIVYNMILNGKNFIGIESSDYQDWGTLSEWQKYKNNFLTLFVDIDGVIVENSSVYLTPYIGTTKL